MSGFVFKENFLVLEYISYVFPQLFIYVRHSLHDWEYWLIIFHIDKEKKVQSKFQVQDNEPKLFLKFQERNLDHFLKLCSRMLLWYKRARLILSFIRKDIAKETENTFFLFFYYVNMCFHQ